MGLVITQFGMSLVQMGKPSERVCFLDDVDITLSLDNRITSSQNMSTTEITIGPLIFRVSYRDINLIMSIFNKAFQQYDDFYKSLEPKPSVKETSLASGLSTETPLTTASTAPRSGMSGHAKVLTSKEQVCEDV
jgi:vacuolar protein sorting-associated protein 13A/C